MVLVEAEQMTRLNIERATKACVRSSFDSLIMLTGFCVESSRQDQLFKQFGYYDIA